MKKGYVLTWDATVALTFVLLILVGFLSIPYFRDIGIREVGFQQTHRTSEDAMEVLSKSGKLSVIGAKWEAGDFSNETEMEEGDIHGASLEVKNFLDSIVPESAGYELYMGDTLIYSSELDNSSDRIDTADAKDKTRAIRFISGYITENETQGWVASASLSQNLSGEVDWLLYEGSQQWDFDIPLNKDDQEEVAHLVLPKTAFVYDGRMNISWRPACWPLCPLWGP